ncbi:MAG: transposase [Cyanobacteriota bacterium]|nr:transposase [Cyanobacteriota bacterium]
MTEYFYRRSIRLSGYDYGQAGAYFVTICTHQKYCWFGEIRQGVMYQNFLGSAVAAIWHNLPSHFPFLELDAFVVMPNHLHGILIITNARPLSTPESRKGTKSGSVGAIVQNFKSTSTRRINRINGDRKTIWQRNYYEHIIRTDRAYENIRRYILENPPRWHNDDENPNRLPRHPPNPPNPSKPPHNTP